MGESEESLFDEVAQEAKQEFTESALADSAKAWLENFTKQGEPVYATRLHEMSPEHGALTIDAQHLADTNGKHLLNRLLSRGNYHETLTGFGQGAHKLAKDLGVQASSIVVRFRGVEQVRVPLPAVGARHYLQVVTTRGRVVSMSKKKPYAIRFDYHCKDCEKRSTRQIQEVGDVITKPKKCPHCESKKIVIDSANIVSSQLVKIVDVRASSAPTEQTIFLLGEDLCNKVGAGQVVDVFGMVNIDFGKEGKSGSAVFRIDANNIESITGESDEFELSDDDIKRFDKKNPDSIVNLPNFWQIGQNSYAPNVLGYPNVKAACLCLVSSLPLLPQQMQQKGMLSTLRESLTMNMLLAGAHGSAKSRFLRFTSKVAPFGNYISFNGATPDSLIVITTRDENGYAMVTPGFFSKCDRGVACGDEFDKAPKEAYNKLNEIGEHKTVSFSKNGIDGTLPADCCWLFACNSVFRRWNEHADILENLNFMPSSLLDRFDSVFVFLDKAERERDKAIAGQVLANSREEQWEKYMEDEFNGTELVRMGIRTLKKYFQYVCTKVPVPVLPPELDAYIQEHYAEKRQTSDIKDLISARYVNAVRRYAVNHARFLQKPQVEKVDIDFAMVILDDSLRVIGYDPHTQKYDGNLVTGAVPERVIAQQAEDAEILLATFDGICKEKGKEPESGFVTLAELKAKLTADPHKWLEVRVKDTLKLLRDKKQKLYESVNPLEGNKRGWRRV